MASFFWCCEQKIWVIKEFERKFYLHDRIEWHLSTQLFSWWSPLEVYKNILTRSKGYFWKLFCFKVDPRLLLVDPDPDPELLNQHLLRTKKLTKLTRQRIEKNTVKSSIICPEVNKKEFTTGLSMSLVQIIKFIRFLNFL